MSYSFMPRISIAWEGKNPKKQASKINNRMKQSISYNENQGAWCFSGVGGNEAQQYLQYEIDLYS